MGRLPTGVKPIFTAQIIIMSRPDIAGELRAWAEATGRHASDLQREVLEAGWDVIQPKLEEETRPADKPTQRKIAEWIKRVDRSLRPTPAQKREATARRRAAVARAQDATDREIVRARKAKAGTAE